MKTLVVGSNGFLGSHLITKLCAQGWQVSTWNRRLKSNFPGVIAHTGELSQRDKLLAALQGVEIVFHLAWTTVPQTSNEDPLSDAQANVVASLQLLDACVKAGVRKVLFPSSGGTVYGLTDREVLEETAPTEPICAYGITKLAVEKYLSLYRRLHGLDYRILRIANAYGEGQPTNGTQGLIGATFDRMLRHKPLTIWGDGSATRDYVYAGDVADSFIRAAQVELSDSSPRIFNIGSGRGTSVLELLETIKVATSLPLSLHHAPARNCDVDRVVLCNRRTTERLGWIPQTTLEAGLSLTWNWINRQPRQKEAAV